MTKKAVFFAVRKGDFKRNSTVIIQRDILLVKQHAAEMVFGETRLEKIIGT